MYISEDVNGQVNLKHLTLALEKWQSSGLPLVGCFSAASNVTGSFYTSLNYLFFKECYIFLFSIILRSKIYK